MELTALPSEKTGRTPTAQSQAQTRVAEPPTSALARSTHLTASSLLFCRTSSMNSWTLRLNSRQL